MQVVNLSICPLGIDLILEGREHLLEREDLLRFLVLDFPHMPIGATAQFSQHFVVLLDGLL